MSVGTGAGSDDGEGDGEGVGVAVGVGIIDAEGSGSAAIAPSGMESKLATSTTDNRPLSSPKSRLVRNIKIPLKNKHPKPAGVVF